jgi:hypothetical protein
MLHSSKTLKFVIISALIFHTLWIANHLRWVATEQVNPWKLGGYGMYTAPPPRVSLVLLDFRDPAAPRRIDPRAYSLTRYQAMMSFMNINRVFRCAHIKPKELKAFFEENPQFRGNNLGFLYLENKFIKNPVSIKRVRQGRVTIIWTNNDSFEFTSNFCGNQESGKVALS